MDRHGEIQTVLVLCCSEPAGVFKVRSCGFGSGVVTCNGQDYGRPRIMLDEFGWPLKLLLRLRPFLLSQFAYERMKWDVQD